MSDGTCGAPKIRAELADVDGRKVGIRNVSRLMRKAGIAGVSRRRFCVTTTRDGTPTKPDLVERKFKADGPKADPVEAAWRRIRRVDGKCLAERDLSVDVGKGTAPRDC